MAIYEGPSKRCNILFHATYSCIRRRLHLDRYVDNIDKLIGLENETKALDEVSRYKNI